MVGEGLRRCPALAETAARFSAAASFGPYLDNYRDGGSPFAQNMKTPPLPHFQTSLWSQMYGRLHFVHFDRWPRTWQSDSEIVHWIGRAALVLGLVPTAVLLIGLVREGRRSLMVLAGRALCAVYFLDVVALIAGLVRA